MFADMFSLYMRALFLNPYSVGRTYIHTHAHARLYTVKMFRVQFALNSPGSWEELWLIFTNRRQQERESHTFTIDQCNHTHNVRYS